MPIIYCSVSSCTRHARSGGLCIRHGGGRRCSVEGCNKTARRHGLCQGHGGRPDHVKPKKSTTPRRMSKSSVRKTGGIDVTKIAAPIVPLSMKEWDVWFENDKQMTLPKVIEVCDNDSTGVREYVIHV